jgi:peptide/nickel transport system permease protein
MTVYVLQRLARGLLVLLVVSAVVFGLSLLSGDPIALLIPIETTPEQLARLREAHGLADPVPVRFVRFLGELARGDLGYSFRFREPVLPIVMERVGATLELALAATLLTILVAVPAGIVAAVNRGSTIDGLVVGGAVLGYSTPSFFLGLAMIYLLSVVVPLLPTSGRGSLAHLVMPTITLGLLYAGRIARLVRSSMIEVLTQDFVRTARAKGLREMWVVAHHGLRNAALPLVTILGLELGTLLGGAVVTETVFAWPGIGRLAIDAVIARDYPIVQAVVMLVATGFVLTNLAVDVLYTYLDPRLRYR